MIMSTESEKIQQIVDKLPQEFQVFAPHYVELLMKFQASEISAMIDSIIGNDIKLAYKMLVEKMSTEELLAEMDRLNAVLIEKKEEALAETQYLKNFINVAIAVGIAAI